MRHHQTFLFSNDSTKKDVMKSSANPSHVSSQAHLHCVLSGDPLWQVKESPSFLSTQMGQCASVRVTGSNVENGLWSPVDYHPLLIIMLFTHSGSKKASCLCDTSCICQSYHPLFCITNPPWKRKVTWLDSSSIFPNLDNSTYAGCLYWFLSQE